MMVTLVKLGGGAVDRVQVGCLSKFESKRLLFGMYFGKNVANANHPCARAECFVSIALLYAMV